MEQPPSSSVSLEELLPLFFRDVSEYVFSINTKGEILFASQSVSSSLGFNIPISESFFDIWADVDSALIHAIESIVNDPSSRKDIQGVIYTTEKEERECEGVVSGFPKESGLAGVLITLKDVTAEKKTRAKYEKNDKLYRILTEEAPLVIYQLSSTGDIQYLNPAFTELTGWGIDEWIGRSFIDLVEQKDIKKAYESFMNPKKKSEVRLSIRKKDGTFIEGEFISMQLTENGIFKGKLGIVKEKTS